LNGFNDGLAYALEARDFENFQGMVSKAPVLENRRGVMERKHKLVHHNQPGSSSRLHVAMPSARPVFHPAQPLFQPKPQVARQGYYTLQHRVIQHPNNFQTPTTRNHSAQRTQAAENPLQGERRCYTWGERSLCQPMPPIRATALLR
jgi:hypothetical protein